MKTFTSKSELKQAIEDYFFNKAKGDSDISNWDTSQITDMSKLFEYIKQKTVEPIILNWDTSNVTNMSRMFYYCEQDFILNFRRHEVGNESQKALCNTSNVTNMSFMFTFACNFNQPLNFDTSNVKNMSYMFHGATKFNQPLHFNTTNVVDINNMFYEATNFNQPLFFDTSNVNNIWFIFYAATAFNNPIYFQLDDDKYDMRIFEKSLLEKQEKKYVLTSQFYKKLLVFYVLNQLTSELLYICDTFEEFL